MRHFGKGGSSASDTPAPESPAAVASFRTWWVRCRAHALSTDNACGAERPSRKTGVQETQEHFPADRPWMAGPVADPWMAACGDSLCESSPDNACDILARVAAPPATLRHPSHLLPLLPSGPGGVHKLSSRRHQRSHHRLADSSSRRVAKKLAERAGCTRHFLCLALRAACAARIGCPADASNPSYLFSRVRTRFPTVPQTKHPVTRSAEDAQNWRRERDSNPRSGVKPLTHFPGVLLQPLGHLSAFHATHASWHAATGRGGY